MPNPFAAFSALAARSLPAIQFSARPPTATNNPPQKGRLYLCGKITAYTTIQTDFELLFYMGVFFSKLLPDIVSL
jgi:hypothetical protein